ncbi:MAG: iron-containing alcohol dehydrogenase [Candidatus Aminicenantes bacterium]|jgi:alcohol dehydrogenase class IV
MNYDRFLQKTIQKFKGGSEYLRMLDIHVGSNVDEKISAKISSFGKTVLFCSGRSAMKKLKFHKKYIDLLMNNGVKVVEYSGICANPTLETIEEGIRIAKKGKVDFVFCLGGGSVIDSGKAVSAGLFGDVWDFIEKRSEIIRSLPVVAVSTTSGTGSHVTPYAVINNSDTCEKKTLRHKLLVPKLSLVDMNITENVPPYIIATTGFDVLCHAVEVYTLEDSDGASSEFALKAIELVGKHLYNSFSNKSREDKEGMAYADIFAGIALALKKTHVAHAISHPITARFPEINHGHALACVATKTLDMQFKRVEGEIKKRFHEINFALGIDSDLPSSLKKLIQNLKLDKPVRKMSAEDLQTLYEDTVGYRWSSVERSPCPMSKEDIKNIIFESFSDLKCSS